MSLDRIIVKDGQSGLDIAVQFYGKVENVVDIMMANPALFSDGILSPIASGASIDLTIQNNSTVTAIAVTGKDVCGGAIEDEGGIELWEIETEFEIQ